MAQSDDRCNVLEQHVGEGGRHSATLLRRQLADCASLIRANPPYGYGNPGSAAALELHSRMAFTKTGAGDGT